MAEGALYPHSSGWKQKLTLAENPILSIAFYQEVLRPGFAPSALRRPAGASRESAGLRSASLFPIAQSPAEITVLLASKLLIFNSFSFG